MRCPACGTDNDDSSFYCKKCGANLKAAARTGEEDYLGGVYSPSIVRDKIPNWKFAVHATNRRLLAVSAAGGLKQAGWGVLDNLAFLSLGHSSGDYVRKFKPQKSKEENARIIQELDSSPKKDFELLREDIYRIDTKKPGVFAPRGYVKIIPKSGSEIKLQITDRTAFQTLMKLLIAFLPEASMGSK